MFTEEEIIAAIQDSYPTHAIEKMQKSGYYTVNNFPFAGVTLRIKPNAFGMFQFHFDPNIITIANGNTLDTYFKSQLVHAEGSSICQLASNRIIYVYPKYTTRIDSCLRLLKDFVQKIEAASPILFGQPRTEEAFGQAQPIPTAAPLPRTRDKSTQPFLFGLITIVAISTVITLMLNRKH